MESKLRDLMLEDISKVEELLEDYDMEDLIEDYSELEKNGCDLDNIELVKEKILEANVMESKDVEIRYSDEDIIYRDVNLSAIAEALSEVYVSDIYNQLGFYGSWDVELCDGMYYLIDMQR